MTINIQAITTTAGPTTDTTEATREATSKATSEATYHHLHCQHQHHHHQQQQQEQQQQEYCDYFYDESKTGCIVTYEVSYPSGLSSSLMHHILDKGHLL